MVSVPSIRGTFCYFIKAPHPCNASKPRGEWRPMGRPRSAAWQGKEYIPVFFARAGPRRKTPDPYTY
jgi:hypothetical protein